MTIRARKSSMLLAEAALVALAACADDSARMPAAQPAIVIAPPPPPPSAMAPVPQVAPMAPAPMMAAPAPQAAQAPSMVLAGHLASYRTAESAQAGWQQYVRQQPALQTLKPYFVPVTINGQPWIRLLAGDFPNAEDVVRKIAADFANHDIAIDAAEIRAQIRRFGG